MWTFQLVFICPSYVPELPVWHLAERPEKVTRNLLDALIPKEREKPGCDGLVLQALEPSIKQMPPNGTMTPREGFFHQMILHSDSSDPPQDRACPDVPYTERFFWPLLNLVISSELVLVLNTTLQSQVICHKGVPDKRIPAFLLILENKGKTFLESSPLTDFPSPSYPCWQ